MIDIYDGVLETHVAELIHLQMKEVYWQYDYHSQNGQVNKHWHVLGGHDDDEVIKNGYEWLLPIWNTSIKKYNFEDKYKVNRYKRLYMNAHTHGIEPHLHKDEGDFTMIYYPRLDWRMSWQGGTLVDGELIPYVGNRLIVFPAKNPHQAQAVCRECYELRSVVVFKTSIMGQ